LRGTFVKETKGKKKENLNGLASFPREVEIMKKTLKKKRWEKGRNLGERKGSGKVWSPTDLHGGGKTPWSEGKKTTEAFRGFPN